MLLIVCDKTKRKTEERLKKTHIESDFGGSSARNWFPRSRSESAAWSLLVMFQIVLDCPWSCSRLDPWWIEFCFWLRTSRDRTGKYNQWAKYVFAKSQLDRTLDLFCVQVKLKICLCVIVQRNDSARECFLETAFYRPDKIGVWRWLVGKFEEAALVLVFVKFVTICPNPFLPFYTFHNFTSILIQLIQSAAFFRAKMELCIFPNLLTRQEIIVLVQGSVICESYLGSNAGLTCTCFVA